MAVTINADNGAVSGSAGLKYSSDSTGVLALQTNGTTAVSISTGQVVTLANALPVASGGTGATSNAAAPFALKGANSDITSLTGLTTALSLAQGGTAATSASAARTSLGLVIGTDVLAPNGSAASLTSFPTLNQNTTGSAATVTGDATGSTFGFNSGYGSVATAYGCRAWVNFNGTANSNLSGTYARTSPSTTLTVTATAHGLIAGNSVNLDFTTGIGLDGIYTVVTVVDANIFTITTVASTNASGNVTLLRNTIRASGNVSSITDNGTGDYTVNFKTAMPDANYASTFGCSTDALLNNKVSDNVIIADISANYLRVYTGFYAGSHTLRDDLYVTVSIFR